MFYWWANYTTSSSSNLLLYFDIWQFSLLTVHQLARVEGPKCRAAISLLSSRIEALEFTNSGAKLAVGYECCRVSLNSFNFLSNSFKWIILLTTIFSHFSLTRMSTSDDSIFQIAVLDMNSLSALFLTDIISSPNSTLKSMICKVLVDGQVEHLKHSGIRDTDGQVKNLIFILTMNGAVYAIDSDSGNRIGPRPMRLKKDSTAVSLYVIGKYYLTKDCESIRLLLI